jgi:beta-mannosidase
MVSVRLDTGWQLCSTPPGQCTQPQSLPPDTAWMAAVVPSTAAATLRATGAWSLDGPARNFDAEDWWYRLEFDLDVRAARSTRLCFDGLATVAEVWLNGEPLLQSDNMYRAHAPDVSDRLRSHNVLHLCFRSLDAHLKARRPRPRWRTPMLAQQQLRWVRTSLLGRTPGWSPSLAAVGPWRPIALETGPRLTPVLGTSVAGTAGHVSVQCQFSGTPAPAMELRVARGAQRHHTALARDGDGYAATLCIDAVELWWPHTHGEPALYDATLHLQWPDGVVEERTLGPIGFRALELDSADGQFLLKVNGEHVFCRGACWTPVDPVSLNARPEQLRQALCQVRDAGMNMLRVGGTMVYETEDFYAACDALGLLVWQDFMFANMDYPEEPAFVASVEEEAKQFLGRTAHHPCLALLCGNSEVEQQAAMWGASRDLWEPSLFHRTLPQLVSALNPGVPYWPSSAHGGAFPHDGSAGSTSYFGVGAYLRPLEDARRAAIRFASECLAFAQVPEPATLARMSADQPLRVHHPRWKERAPRDLGAGWDFDDVRDHYLEALTGLKPLTLRYADHAGYLGWSRVVTGEIMAATFSEWRTSQSTCNGALIWFLRDLWDGAGWGIVDADGSPKAPYYYLRRALQPQAVWISDEGTNGLHVHVINESAAVMSARVRATLYRGGEHCVATAERELPLAPRQCVGVPLATLLDEFLDLSYAYRFGAPPADLIHVQLLDQHGAVRSETHYLPLGLRGLQQRDLGLTAEAAPIADGVALRVRTQRYAHAIHIDAPGHAAADQYFPLAPGAARTILLRPLSATPLRCQVTALNALGVVTAQVPA